jgi:hypothetical protein
MTKEGVARRSAIALWRRAREVNKFNGGDVDSRGE